MGASMPASRIRAMFARRASASIVQPPASMARATSGSPQTHFVTPATAMPWRAQSSVTATALARIFSQSASILIAAIFLLSGSVRDARTPIFAVWRYCTT